MAAVAPFLALAVDTIQIYGIDYGIIGGMDTTKVTVELPVDLLERARASTGEGITATIRRGLEMVAATRAQERLLALRGKVKFSIDLDKLREDRG